MIYILAILIIQIAIVSFMINRMHILNPSCIACAVFLISTIFAIYSKNNWNYQLHTITVVVIASSLIVFSIGTYMGTEIAGKYVNVHPEFARLRMPTFNTIVLITMILLYFSMMHYQTVLRIGVIMGADPHNFGEILNRAREGFLNHTYTITRIDAYSTYFCRSVSYVCLYLYFYDKFVNKNKWVKHCYLFLPVIPLTIKIVLSTGRTDFIYLAVFVIVIYGVLLFQTKGLTSKTILKVVLMGTFAFLTFLLLFSVFQLLRQRESRDLIDVISYYTGMSIPSLDDYLINGRPESNLIGNNTFFQIYDVLRKLGINLPKLYAPYDFVSFNGTRGNVYTAFRRYIEDYTILGNYIILLILGCLSSFSYNYIYKVKNKPYACILYAMFIYPIFEISIEERVFMNLIGLGTIYNLIAFLVVYFILVKNPIRPIRRFTIK